MQSFLRDRNDWGTAVSDAHVSYTRSLLYEREIVQLHHASAAASAVAAVGNNATGSRSRILAPASTRSTSYTAAEEVINIQIFKRRAAITK